MQRLLVRSQDSSHHLSIPVLGYSSKQPGCPRDLDGVSSAEQEGVRPHVRGILDVY